MWHLHKSGIAVFMLLQAGDARGIMIVPCYDPGVSIGADTSQIVNVISVVPSRAPVCSGTRASFLIEIAVMSDDITLKNASASILFCHRSDDCMFVSGSLHVEDVCSLRVYDEEISPALLFQEKQCRFQLGRLVRFQTNMSLPSHLFRGSYDVRLQLDSDQGSGCWWVTNVNLVAGHFWMWVYDYVSAITAFVTASASSYVIGQYFPKVTNGLIPRITGFVLLGVVIGPYVTNFVSRFYIYLLESTINRISLGFIAVAAGAEIYLPHLTGLMTPIVYLVATTGISTFIFITLGLIIFMHLMEVPLMGSCPTEVSIYVIMLTSSIMVARSPSSTVAVIQEMQASGYQAAKLTIGATIISDLVVLVCFALCMHLVSRHDDSFVILVLVITRDIMVSVVYGLMWSFPIEWLLNMWPYEEPRLDSDKQNQSALPFVLLLKHHDWRLVLQGMILLVMIFIMRESEGVFQLIGVKIDPLLVPFFASCYVVHTGVLRRHLHRILASWMPTIFLPFFTLTGASLNLGMVSKLLPWAMLISILRFFAIYSGAAFASWLSDRPATEMKWMGITLISMAGISLGLALEVQDRFTWGHDFSSLVISIVVINQLLGPILCKIGMRKMVAAVDRASNRTTHFTQSTANQEDAYGTEFDPLSPLNTRKQTLGSRPARITSTYGYIDVDEPHFAYGGVAHTDNDDVHSRTRRRSFPEK